MNETFVTLSGWLGGDVSLREEDGDTQWYAVNAWRALAENCDSSLRRGDPVVVHGKLSAHVWTNKAGLEVTTFEIEAAFVGHDLNRGTSTFERRKPASSASAVPGATSEEPAAAAPEATVHAA